jgi:hypothetical protein
VTAHCRGRGGESRPISEDSSLGLRGRRLGLAAAGLDGMAGAGFGGPPSLALLLQIFGLQRVALDQRGERRVGFSARAESWQTADVLFHLRDGVEKPARCGQR